jgi:NAD(P)H dehydrogenase (quinone)
VTANIAVIYSGAAVCEVAQALAEAAGQLSATVRLLRVPKGDEAGEHPEAALGDLEWADGIAFGTPVGAGRPSAALMRFLERAEPLGRDDKLYDKVVTTFTDEPERFAPDPIVHPIWDALYQWGAVIVGPRAYELALDARARRDDASVPGGLAGPRLRTARYRGRRLATLAGVLAADRARRMRLEL